MLLETMVNELEGKGLCLQAFADDDILVIYVMTAAALERETNTVLENAQRRYRLHKLKFAATNAIVVRNRLKDDTPRLIIGGTDSAMRKQIKILGFIIVEKLIFIAHIS